MKRFMGLLVSFIMIVVAFSSVSVSAAIVASGRCMPYGWAPTPVVTWTLDDSGVLTMNGNGCSVCSNCGHFDWADYIKKCVISEGIDGISESSFYRCTSLKEVVIPSTVEYIKSGAFNGVPLEKIIYNGTPEEWYSITKEERNDVLSSAEIVFTEKTPYEFSFENNVLSIGRKAAGGIQFGLAYIGDLTFEIGTDDFNDLIVKGKNYTYTNSSRGYVTYKGFESKTFYKNGNYVAFLKYNDTPGSTVTEYFTFTVTEAKDGFTFDTDTNTLKFEYSTLDPMKMNPGTYELKIGVAYHGDFVFDAENPDWDVFIEKGKEYSDINGKDGYVLNYTCPTKTFKTKGNYAAFVKYIGDGKKAVVDYITFTVDYDYEKPVLEFDSETSTLKLDSGTLTKYKLGVSYHGDYAFDTENPDWDTFVKNGKRYTNLNGGTGYVLYNDTCPAKVFKTPGNYVAFIKYTDDKSKTNVDYINFEIKSDFEKPVLKFNNTTNTFELDVNDAQSYRIGVSYIGNSVLSNSSWDAFVSNGKKYTNMNGASGYVLYKETLPAKVYKTKGNYQAFIKYTDNNGKTYSDYMTFTIA